MSQKIIEILFNSPNVVNISSKDDIEVQPGVFSSVYINLKSLFSNCKNRIFISNAIERMAPKDVDYICGIESGGSYFASAVSDLMAKNLLLFRKSEKKYNIKNRFAGDLPKKGNKILIIDDVISSGNTIADAVNNLKNLGCKAEVIVVFSYGWEKEIEKKLNIKISVLSNAKEFIRVGSKNKVLNKQNIKLINEYIKREDSRVYKITKGGDNDRTISYIV